MKLDLAERFLSRHALKTPPHITLFPPFHWNKRSLSQLVSTLGKISFTQPFNLTITGYGVFAPKTIFLNLTPEKSIMALQSEVTQVVEALMTDPNPKRTFHPHITLMTRDLGKTAFRKAWKLLEPQVFNAQFRARHFTLYEHDGAQWNGILNFGTNPI